MEDTFYYSSSLHYFHLLPEENPPIATQWSLIKCYSRMFTSLVKVPLVLVNLAVYFQESSESINAGLSSSVHHHSPLLIPSHHLLLSQNHFQYKYCT